MKIKIQTLAAAGLMLGSLFTARAAQAAGPDHAAIAAKYEKLAATQQDVIDQTRKLEARDRAHGANPKALDAARVEQSRQGYEAVIAASAKEQAELLRYAKWHRLEASGTADKVEALIAEQKAAIADNGQLKAQARQAVPAGKPGASERYAKNDKLYDAKIEAASAELADLQGFAAWHKLAQGSADEVAKLTAEQEALVAEHQKMKMENRSGYVNEKVTPDSRYVAMDRHCDRLIADASRQLVALKELAQN